MANYSIILTRSAAKDLEAVPTKDRQRIVTRIRALGKNSGPVGVEKLSAGDKYRIRQGDYRILYEIVDEQLDCDRRAQREPTRGLPPVRGVSASR